MNDKYESGAYWRHKDLKKVVNVVATFEDQVTFKYKDLDPASYNTSKPLFELFFEPMDPEEVGMILLNELD